MPRLEPDPFLIALPKFFERNKDHGSVWITFKKCMYLLISRPLRPFFCQVLPLIFFFHFCLLTLLSFESITDNPAKAAEKHPQKKLSALPSSKSKPAPSASTAGPSSSTPSSSPTPSSSSKPTKTTKHTASTSSQSKKPSTSSKPKKAPEVLNED